MKIKFCTPYYNEFAYDRLGNITYNPDYSPPAEKSINKLVQLAETDDIIYKPGTLYETLWFSFSWQRCRGTYIAEARNALVNLKAKQCCQADFARAVRLLHNSGLRYQFYTVNETVLIKIDVENVMTDGYRMDLKNGWKSRKI